MEKLKFYVSDEKKLNSYEIENKKISYRTLVKYLFTDMILCNELPKVLSELDEFIEDNPECGTIYDEENECYCYDDIYQYFIVDFSSCNYDFIKKYCQDEIILFYSEKLDLYILGVTHFGTSWDYVLTDFEYTTEYENSMQDNLYKE